MTTYSAPFSYDEQIAGVVTAGLSLAHLESIIDKDEIGEGKIFVQPRKA